MCVYMSYVEVTLPIETIPLYVFWGLALVNTEKCFSNLLLALFPKVYMVAEQVSPSMSHFL